MTNQNAASKPPTVVTSIQNGIEMTADPSSQDDNDELTFDGNLDDDPSQDEDAKYVQIVAPQRRNRRLARSYNKIQTPLHAVTS
jgi:hypothetical protein